MQTERSIYRAMPIDVLTDTGSRSSWDHPEKPLQDSTRP